MDYDALATAFLTPGPTTPAAPAVPDSLSRRLRDALEPVATIGWWSRSAAEAAAPHGVDFFGGYVWGRAAPLGADVEPQVVAAAFGVMAPELIVSSLISARRAVSRADILATREAGATAGLRLATAELPEADVQALAQQLLDALLQCAGTGRPLFSALRSLPVPTTAHGALWRAAELFREHRGDGHLAACLAAGLDPVEMNVLTELWLDYGIGEYSATRGFSADAIQQAAAGLRQRGWVTGDRLTDLGRRQRDAIEAATDLTQQSVISALGGTVEPVITAATAVGDAVLRARAAPADPRKRAAG